VDLTPPDPQRYVRWGPLHVRPGLELSHLGYDDNILSSASAPVSDFTATLVPHVDGLIRLGRPAFVTFRERLSYTSHLHHPDQNYWNQRGAARVVVPLRRVGLFADVRADRLKERPIDQEDLRPERAEDERVVGLVLDPGWRGRIEISQGRTRVRYSDPDAVPAGAPTIAERLDRHEDTTRAGLRYLVRGRTRATLEGEWQRIDFVAAVASGRDSRAWSLAPGVEFGTDGPLSGSARLGWREIRARDAAVGDFSDLVARARLAYRMGSDARIELELDRQPGFTVEGPSVYYLDTRGDARWLRYLNRLVGVEIGGGLERLSFPGATPGAQREDDLARAELGLRLRLADSGNLRRAEYSLRLRRESRDSTDDSQDRTRTTVGLGAVLGF